MGFIKSNNANKDEAKYEVLENFGTISEKNGWELQLRLVSWNGNDPKYDVRAWKTEDGVEKCRKGLTLTGEEAEGLYKLLKGIATSK